MMRKIQHEIDIKSQTVQQSSKKSPMTRALPFVN